MPINEPNKTVNNGTPLAKVNIKINKDTAAAATAATSVVFKLGDNVDVSSSIIRSKHEQIIDEFVDEAEKEQYFKRQCQYQQQSQRQGKNKYAQEQIIAALTEDETDYQQFVEIFENQTLKEQQQQLNSSAQTTATATLYKRKSSAVAVAFEEENVKNYVISNQPSPASKGLENTFKLLKHQVDTKTQKTWSLMQTLKPLSPNTETSETALSFKCTDLEIEAIQRIQKILNAMQQLQTQQHQQQQTTAQHTTDCDKTNATIDAPLLSLLCHFVPNKLLEEEIIMQQRKCLMAQKTICHHHDDHDVVDVNDDIEICADHEIKSSNENDNDDILYRAAIDSEGKKCLKIVRHPRHRKVLCGNRVSQMTRAYDDIEAVTRLLEEKEKDLELTVQIGKELLTQNTNLETRVNDLENDLKEANDARSQLMHELHMKNELIAVLTNDGDNGSEAGTPSYSKSITLDLMQQKMQQQVSTLQDENKSLKMEVSQLASQTDEVEEHERELMANIKEQMNEANKEFEKLSLELERQREENLLQHEQIVSLTARLAETEMRLHKLTADNDEHVSLLNITKENQNSLALELVEFKQRYQEVLALLHEAQEQLRKQRKKSMPQARSSFLSSSIGNGVGAVCSGASFLQPESLQSELMESSMYSENSLDSGISGDHQRINDRIGRLLSQLPGGASMYGSTSAGTAGGMATAQMMPPYKRVFETVRCASKNGNYADSGSLSMTQIGSMSLSSTSGPRITSSFSDSHPAGSYYRNSLYEGSGIIVNHSMGNKTLSMESLGSQSEDSYPAQPSGVPGAPGAKDLEAALKRLTPAEVLARRAMLSYAPAGTYTYDEQQPGGGGGGGSGAAGGNTLPLGVRTPDSIMSTGSSGISSTNMSAVLQQWRLPEKLQIVKPIEGSQTLHHWSRLATPTLSGLLEDRPGVTIRGGRNLDDLGMQVYTLSDVEEDISEDLPGKQFESTGCTYTYSTSVVMHPDDGLVNDLSFLSQSQMSSRMASNSTSRQPSCPPTPLGGLSRKNSCSTFSTNLGLASMLNERGIKAVTPSALNTPAGPNFSPTVTPCNSPEGSPTRSMSPEPLFGLLSSGADLIRRKLVGNEIERPNRIQQQNAKQKIMLSRLERRALRSLKLVEKVESIGLENIIATQSTISGIANRNSSPFSQLGSLKQFHTNSNNIVDDIHFDREQIKGVLHKGLTSPSSALSLSSLASSDESEIMATATATSSKSNTSGKVNNAQNDIAQPPVAAIAPLPEIASLAATSTQQTIPSATDTRLKQMQRQKSRRNLKNGMAVQRQDLGTIGGGNAGASGGRVRADLGKVSATALASSAAKQESSITTTTATTTTKTMDDIEREETTQSLTQSFVGTVSSLLFGRKGGWL